jgi:hypothetical protein
MVNVKSVKTKIAACGFGIKGLYTRALKHEGRLPMVQNLYVMVAKCT